MSTAVFDNHLNLLERLLEQVSVALNSQQTNDLNTSCATLQSAVVDFSAFLQRMPVNVRLDTQRQLRVKKMATVLAFQRESLIRRGVLVEQALGTLVPKSQSSTYAPANGKYARQPYGSTGRKSGEFQAVCA